VEQMNSQYAGWGDLQLELTRYRTARKMLNGTSLQKTRAGLAGFIRERIGIVPIRTRERLHERPVKVQIFGQTYSIQGELDGKYVQKLAKYVDEKMHEIADVTRRWTRRKSRCLAALAIADELHSMQSGTSAIMMSCCASRPSAA